MIGILAGPAERGVSGFLPAALRTPVVRTTGTLALRTTLCRSPKVPNLPLDSCMTRDAKHLQIIRFIRCADTKRNPMVDVQFAAVHLLVAFARHAAFLTRRTAPIDRVDTSACPVVAVPIIESAAPVGVPLTSDLRSMFSARAIVRTVVRRSPYVARYLLERHAAPITGERHTLSAGHGSAFMRAKSLTALVAIHPGSGQGERLAACFTGPRNWVRLQPQIPSVLPSIMGVF